MASPARPIPSQLQEKHCVAVRLPPGRPLPPQIPLNKGPVIRKSVEAFYFAAHAYAKLRNKDPATGTVWNPAITDNGVPIGLLASWFPEVGTLVLAYAAHEKLALQRNYETPFYVPDGWDTKVMYDFNKAFKLLHVPSANASGHWDDDVLKAANARLLEYSNGMIPMRIVLCGFSFGGALAGVAAPWVALAYPSADTRLITFGTPG